MYPIVNYAAAALVLGALSGTAKADENVTKTEKKTVTIIEAQTSADGSSEVRRELLSNCIQSLPDPANVEPQVASEAIFLREIDGVAGKNEWAKAYTAKLDVNYLTQEKELIIITTRSVQGQEPVIKEVEKQLKNSESFASDPSEGGTAAGRSKREYYFTKREDAIKDVRERARVWINQQKAVLCSAGK